MGFAVRFLCFVLRVAQPPPAPSSLSAEKAETERKLILDLRSPPHPAIWALFDLGAYNLSPPRRRALEATREFFRKLEKDPVVSGELRVTEISSKERWLKSTETKCSWTLATKQRV